MSGKADPGIPLRLFRAFPAFAGGLLAGLLLSSQALASEEGVPIDRKAVVQAALSSHPLVSIAYARSRAQTEKVGTALADYYPHIALSLDQLFLNTAFVGGVFPDYQPIAPEMLNPTLTQDITAFGRRHYRVRAERLRLRSRKEEFSEARLSVSFRANVAYDQLAMFEHLYRAARKNEEDAALHLRMAQERLARGFGVITDVTMARLLLEKTRLERIRQGNALRKAQADLIFAMGRETMVSYRTDGTPRRTGPSWSLDKMIAYALSHRPLLQAALALDREKETDVQEIRTRNYPHLSLFAQGFILWGVPTNISGAPPGSGGMGLFLPTFQSGVTLSVPIFVGGAILHDTEQARMEARQESEKTRLVRLRIIRNVRKLYDDFETQRETLTLDQARFDHAQENLRLVERRFARGLVDGVTAVDAETEVLTSRERLIADRFRLSMIQDRLDREMGLRRDF